ncbi:MAG: DUF4159 domain-containing protein [Lentisphaerae bacterium]|jgi:hypothetical protein|nr:DUF4159 domain-containing protein [Lentisphaerota bacterium]MBT4816073.1 DUF4159 domain-containing protein [Lentisphaerota bacterium]MBT5613158.1 DUF4159 domain-containing protein [Lentisphaerota bacterium]MBT7061942.1 DUF4159 domain-containing protein [Lentisphaerota bacterium]MBT7844550.1 DUF4159 domain-containing protein [Lentisphaerota bacterium]
MKAQLRLASSVLVLVGWLGAEALGGLLDGFGLNSTVVKEEQNYTCTPKPPAKPPAQHSGAEGLPPLPLPAVPLRRTEKKNPPRPPVLIAKIATKRRSDWATNPADSKNLLRWMAKDLNVHFSSINLPQDRIPTNPQQIPVLYRTGHEAFEFSSNDRKKLREYLLRGGTVIFDACCGRRAFVESALREVQQLVPERPPYRLTMDHPIYHSFFDIKNIQYRPWALKAGAKTGEPSCVGIDIGCRTAAFFFRWDVSCGWDYLKDSDRHHCLGYHVDSARKIGANLMAYVTAERSAALPLSKALDFVDATKGKSGKFIIAQASYKGMWKTREAGLSMLLNSFHDQTKTPVRFAREEVALDSSRLFEVPFIYLTGHQDFVLTPQERSNLRQYLMRGGILFAESCCGREAFDRSFRFEISKVLNGQKLDRLPSAHPLFLFPNQVKGVQPRPALSRKLGAKGKIVPALFGVNVNGNVAVVYAPHGLACGWELAQCPYCSGIESADSLALGVNILSYAIMQ